MNNMHAPADDMASAQKSAGHGVVQDQSLDFFLNSIICLPSRGLAPSSQGKNLILQQNVFFVLMGSNTCEATTHNVLVPPGML